jgi:hypothetical protein
MLGGLLPPLGSARVPTGFGVAGVFGLAILYGLAFATVAHASTAGWEVAPSRAVCR